MGHISVWIFCPSVLPYINDFVIGQRELMRDILVETGQITTTKTLILP